MSAYPEMGKWRDSIYVSLIAWQLNRCRPAAKIRRVCNLSKSFVSDMNSLPVCIFSSSGSLPKRSLRRKSVLVDRQTVSIGGSKYEEQRFLCQIVYYSSSYNTQQFPLLLLEDLCEFLDIACVNISTKIKV